MATRNRSRCSFAAVCLVPLAFAGCEHDDATSGSPPDPTVIATLANENAESIAVDDAYVYVAGYQTSLRRIPLAGGEPERIADVPYAKYWAQLLRAGPGGVFWFEETDKTIGYKTGENVDELGKMLRQVTPGGTARDLVWLDLEASESFAMNRTRVYWFDPLPPSLEPLLRTMKLDGSDAQTMTVDNDFAEGVPFAATDQELFYFHCHDLDKEDFICQLVRTTLTEGGTRLGDSQTVDTLAKDELPRWLALSGDELFYTFNHPLAATVHGELDETLKIAPLDGGEPRTVATLDLEDAMQRDNTGWRINDGHLYFTRDGGPSNTTNFYGTSLRRVRPDGGIEDVLKPDQVPVSFAFGPDGTLYWSDGTSIHRERITG